MQTWIVMLALVSSSPAGPLDGQSFESANQALQCLEPGVATGTLLATEGDCLAVRVYTQSPYTHVAAVVRRNGKALVYDSANGVGVRCQTLESYIKSQGPKQIHVLDPVQPFNDSQTSRFETWLDSQLGRPYSVNHHLTGDRCEGLHCAEYVTDALISSGLMTAEHPARVSPASLIEGVTRHGVYASMQTIRIEPPEQAPVEATSWYGRLWASTKSCTVSCCRKTRGWFLCR